MRIWGISGKLGSGKDWYGDKLLNILREEGRYPLKICFADAIKVNLAAKEDYNVLDLFGSKLPEIRRKLQTEGTEVGRKTYGNDIWVKTVEAWCKIYESRGFTDFIITDVRFKNEADWIVSMDGVLIRLNASDRNCERLLVESNGDPDLYETISKHSSETDLDNYTKFNKIIDNSKTSRYLVDYFKIYILTILEIEKSISKPHRD